MYNALIVDDEPAILQGMQNLLQWEDYGIVLREQACNGLQALEILTREPVGTFDILITDIKMPVMDGLELIETLRQTDHEMKIIITSGYNDFPLVKRAITTGIENYLLKPIVVDELAATLLAMIQKIQRERESQRLYIADTEILRTNILGRWLKNAIMMDELEQRADVLGLALNSRQYAVCLVQKKRGEDEWETDARPGRSLSHLLMGTAVLPEDHHVLVTKDEHGFDVLIFHGILNDGWAMRNWLQGTLDNLQEGIWFAALGNVVDNKKQLSSSYEYAFSLLDYRLIAKKNLVIDPHTVHAIRQEGILYKVDQERMKALLLSCDDAGIEAFLNNEYEVVGNTHGMTPGYLRSHAMELIQIIMSALRSTGDGADSFFSTDDSAFLQLLTANSLSAMAGWMKALSFRAIGLLRNALMEENPLVRRIKDLIEKDCTKSLSLKTLAQQFNTNASYLGQLFIKDTGTPFSAYLNKQRLTYATALLVSTNLEVQEISEKVGYVNIGYFCTLFKKEYGMYPLKYRQVQRS